MLRADGRTQGRLLLTMTYRFDDIVQEHGGVLLRHLTRQVGNATLAEDLLQDTLLRVAKGLPGFEGRASLKTWLFAIANHVVADHLRGPQLRHKIIAIEEMDEPESPEVPPAEQLVIDEMNQCVREVIDSLPADYRAALVLCDLEDMSNAEMAEVLGITLAAAKVRLHRARSRLRRALESSCGLYTDSQSVLRCERRDS